MSLLEALRLLLVLSILNLSRCSPTSLNPKYRFLDDDSTLNKRQEGFFSVLGVAGLGNTQPQPRLEIRELEKNADQWNVYLLGLRRMQSVDQRDKLSYYQIAGIHGRPYIPWDGVNSGSPGSGGGYCPHGANIFPTWHRPYLALFEELLYLNARQAISEFANGDRKTRYTNALQTLRAPYWDSAAVPPSGQGSMPWSIQRPTIDIVLPNGTTNVPNPLFSYTFHPLQTSDFVDTPWTLYPSTVRSPSSKDNQGASRNDLVALDLDHNRPNLQSRVYNVLAMQHDYTTISNNLRPGDSLESVHDVIHNMVGGQGGHMSELAYSAFDPVFWLHHVNVDRMFAIWQALNPNSYVTEVRNPYATFTTPGNSLADTNSPLTPFHRSDDGTFWTSESTRSTTVFAYTYPELIGLSGNDASSLISRVNVLYGPNATPQSKRSISPRAVLGAPTFSGERQYIVNIKAHKFGLSGSFNVYIFLEGSTRLGASGNAMNTDSRTWSQEESFVGISAVLAQTGLTDTDKGDQEVNGAVPLTAALEAKVRAGELKSMKEDAVAPYLKANLEWRISTAACGDLISATDAPGFQLSVLWAEVEPARSVNEFPAVKGEYRVLVGATDGQPGGFSRGDVL